MRAENDIEMLVLLKGMLENEDVFLKVMALLRTERDLGETMKGFGMDQKLTIHDFTRWLRKYHPKVVRICYDALDGITYPERVMKELVKGK